MLARQSATLPREFCKVSACFIFNSQCAHALTVLRSLKVVLNFCACIYEGALGRLASLPCRRRCGADRCGAIYLGTMLNPACSRIRASTARPLAVSTYAPLS